MKKTYAVLSLLVLLAMVMAACTPAPAPTEAPAPVEPAPVEPAPTEAPPPPPEMEPLKVGVVTDVGQLEDKSFNQASWEGAEAGAAAVGGTADVIVTQNISDYKQNIQTFVDQGFDVIVTVGFLIGTDTTIAAMENPDVNIHRRRSRDLRG